MCWGFRCSCNDHSGDLRTNSVQANDSTGGSIVVGQPYWSLRCSWTTTLEVQCRWITTLKIQTQASYDAGDFTVVGIPIPVTRGRIQYRQTATMGSLQVSTVGLATFYFCQALVISYPIVTARHVLCFSAVWAISPQFFWILDLRLAEKPGHIHPILLPSYYPSIA